MTNFTAPRGLLTTLLIAACSSQPDAAPEPSSAAGAANASGASSGAAPSSGGSAGLASAAGTGGSTAGGGMAGSGGGVMAGGGDSGGAGGGSLRYTIHNELASARNELVEISWAEIALALSGVQPVGIVVRELAGAELASQAVDVDGNAEPETLLLRINLAASEVKTIEIAPGTPAPVEQMVHARFVPERLDDFAWENDRTIQRVYGPALQSSPGETSGSGVDVWVKNTTELVMDAWYAANDYHVDHGQGLDAYTVGTTRGVGGIAVWQGGTLYASQDFVSWNVLANGPLRAIFELTYAPWDAAGISVSEVKRVTLDVGSQLSRMESTITSTAGGSTTVAAGLALATGVPTLAPDQSWATVWQPLDGDSGSLGLALVATSPVTLEQASGHVLAAASVASAGSFAYYAGGGWSKGGFADNAAWNTYAEGFAARLASPLKVSPAP